MAWKEVLSSYLKSKGLRDSQQRNRIADLLLSDGDHFSAQEAIERVRKKHGEIGPATVYRNLKLFVEAGILRETLDDADGRMIFEFHRGADEHHDHIVCLDCGVIVEYHDAKIEAAQDQVAARLGFKVERHKHVLYAHCAYRASAK